MKTQAISKIILKLYEIFETTRSTIDFVKYTV